MKSWLKISCVLCVFGFLREMRPSEPYHAEILVSDWYQFTADEVNRFVYPVGCYSQLALLIVVFLITDFLRYKPLIIANAAAGVVIWTAWIFTTTLPVLQGTEVLYGFYSATEVAYYSYIYAKVEKQYYPKVTSHTRAATFVGKLVAGFLSQLVIGMKWMNLQELFYITLSPQVLAFIWGFFLPRVEKSLYFHNKTEAIQENVQSDANGLENASEPRKELDSESKNPSFSKKINQALELIWLHFRSAYTNPLVVQWSLWYAVNYAGYQQITTYMQVAWNSFDDKPVTIWNGAVDAALTFLSAVFAILAGYLHAGRFKPKTSLIGMALLSILEGCCVLLTCWPKNIYWSYIGFVLYGAIFAFAITMASSELASSLEEDSFALIFGFNTFVALLLQCVMTLVVISETIGLNLSVVQQYSVYAFYYIVLGFLYLIAISLRSAFTCLQGKKQSKSEA
ncbi:hypothetical protein KR074_003981 [Drosophila pseudoananassae]|nr:hypothetical protein KR074_003981 [Drosophila pseudoananassae]